MTERASSDDRGLAWVRLTAIAGVLVLAGVGAGAMLDADAGPTADEVLAGVEERYDGAESYVGTVAVAATYTNESGTYDRSGRAEVQYLAPDGHRVEVLAPDEYNGTVAATNGSVAWVSRGTGTALVRPLNATQQDWLARANVSAAVDRLQENASVTLRGTATLDGTETYVLDVRPDNESYDANATVWVDAEDYRVHRVETVGSRDGTTVRTTTRFESFRFGVDIHESTFQPPSDRSVVLASLDHTDYDSLDAASADLAFDVARPAVPDGFETDRVVVGRYGEDATLTATYTNGSDRFAVVQSERDPLSRIDADDDAESVTLGDVDASYLRTRDVGVVFWRSGNLTYAVAGSPDRETLVAVAESMVE